MAGKNGVVRANDHHVEQKVFALLGNTDRGVPPGQYRDSLYLRERRIGDILEIRVYFRGQRINGSVGENSTDSLCRSERQRVLPSLRRSIRSASWRRDEYERTEHQHGYEDTRVGMGGTRTISEEFLVAAAPEDKTRPGAVHKFLGARVEKIIVRTRDTRRSRQRIRGGNERRTDGCDPEKGTLKK